MAKSVPRCGKKPDGQRKAGLEQLRQAQKRKKLDKQDPPYVPEEVPRKKNRKSGSNTDVRFVCFVILFVHTDEFI